MAKRRLWRAIRGVILIVDHIPVFPANRRDAGCGVVLILEVRQRRAVGKAIEDLGGAVGRVVFEVRVAIVGQDLGGHLAIGIVLVVCGPETAARSELVPARVEMPGRLESALLVVLS